MKLINFLFLFCSLNSYAAEVKRLVSTTLDLSKAAKIYLSYELVSSVKFPSSITEAKVGNPDTVKVLISKTLSSELSLRLTSHTSTPTNLIVRCSHKVFVIDLIPSQNLHQDYVKVTGSYSDPEYEDQDAKLIESSVQKIKPITKLELIDSSENHL